MGDNMTSEIYPHSPLFKVEGVRGVGGGWDLPLKEIISVFFLSFLGL